jgi:hypothetical protein
MFCENRRLNKNAGMPQRRVATPITVQSMPDLLD